MKEIVYTSKLGFGDIGSFIFFDNHWETLDTIVKKKLAPMKDYDVNTAYELRYKRVGDKRISLLIRFDMLRVSNVEKNDNIEVDLYRLVDGSIEYICTVNLLKFTDIIKKNKKNETVEYINIGKEGRRRRKSVSKTDEVFSLWKKQEANKVLTFTVDYEGLLSAIYLPQSKNMISLREYASGIMEFYEIVDDELREIELLAIAGDMVNNVFSIGR